MRFETSLVLATVAWGRLAVRDGASIDGLEAFSGQAIRRASFTCAGVESTGYAAWFEALRGEGRMPAMGALGAGVVLEARSAASAETFALRLELVAPRPPGSPPYDALFRADGTRPIAPEPGLESATAQLRAALDGLVSLGTRADLGGWTRSFAASRAVFDEGAPDVWKLFPRAPPAPVRTLAYAAASADVFGGMGSWNDFVPLADVALEGERSRLSSALYEALALAVRVSANAV